MSRPVMGHPNSKTDGGLPAKRPKVDSPNAVTQNAQMNTDSEFEVRASSCTPLEMQGHNTEAPGLGHGDSDPVPGMENAETGPEGKCTSDDDEDLLDVPFTEAQLDCYQEDLHFETLRTSYDINNSDMQGSECATSSATTSTSENSDVALPDLATPVAPVYSFQGHVDSSAQGLSSSSAAENESCNQADYDSGMDTPPPVRYSSNDLLRRVLHELGQMWDRGEELMAQRVAQEIGDLAILFHAHPQGRILEQLAMEAAVYRDESFELGDILTPRWQQWLVALVADAERSATTEEADDEEVDVEDATSLMGFKGRKGASSERRRRRTRSRTPQRGTDRPWRRPWRRTSEETKRESRSRTHDREREWRCAEAPEAPSHTSRRVGAPSTSTLAAETLLLNRLTWRSILCMEVSAPGGSSNQTLSEPLDQDQMNNVQSTAMQMSPGERLAFLASLMQFLMEVGHQIASNIVVGGVPIAEAPYEEDDDVMTMQVSMRSSLTKSGMEFDHIQISLEKGGHKRQRAGLLYRQLQAQPHLANHPELSTLMAMLLVYRDDSYGDMDETTSDADAAWAQTFPSSVLQMVTISGATSSMAPAILVDTPVEHGPTDMPQVNDRGRSRSPTRPAPCPEQLQREAQRYREWEDWTMHQEMHHPRCVSAGLVLDVGAKADGVMHQVSLPIPTESLLNVEICLRFRRPQYIGTTST